MCAVLASGTQIQVSIGLVTMNGSALSMFLLPVGGGIVELMVTCHT